MPDTMPGILDILLDLALLPAGGRVTELCLKDVVADHGGEACVDVACFTDANLVDGSLHVVLDAAAGHAA